MMVGENKPISSRGRVHSWWGGGRVSQSAVWGVSTHDGRRE